MTSVCDRESDWVSDRGGGKKNPRRDWKMIDLVIKTDDTSARPAEWCVYISFNIRVVVDICIPALGPHGNKFTFHVSSRARGSCYKFDTL